MSKKLKILYLISFFFSTAYAFTAYINSTYLEKFVSAKFVGLIFSLGSLLAIIGLSKIPKLLARKGNLKIGISLLLMSVLALFGLGLFQSSFLVVSVFVIYIILSYLFVFSRDIFIEIYSENQMTGRIRGALLTAINLGWVLAPLASALLLENFGYKAVYFLAAISLIPALILLGLHFRNFKDVAYEQIPFWKTLKRIVTNRDIRGIYIANFILQFFYSWMIIYTPIYLHEYMNFSWTSIGIIFVPMLLPFVMLQYPLGALSDKIGEKKMLYAGFMIMILSTASLSYLGPDLWSWALALFMTRVGAATVEVMTESYFFKKISAKQDETISFYRNAAPISFILGPICAGIFLSFFPFQYIYLALGIILFLGLKYTSEIKETL